jgi:uncharacterized protein (TIGR04551 family)
LLLAANVARADGITETLDDRVDVEGSTRLRGGLLYNFDLDRGLTPSGNALFPSDPDDPKSQTRTVRDLRVRVGLTAHTEGRTAELVLGADVIDGLGGTSLADASGRPDNRGRLQLRNAFVTVLTPFGVAVAGRMGNQFGLGMIANSGDCFDCDSSDSADRIGLIVPVRGFYVATSLDVSATTQRVGAQSSELAIDPRNNAHAMTAAILRFRGDEVRAIRRRGGSRTVDYGAAFSYLWQDHDVPAEYLLDDPGMDPASMHRGLRALATVAWARIDDSKFRVEAEAAYVAGSIEQGSTIPGALVREPVGIGQLGAVVQSEIGTPETRYGIGVDAGYASGDPAPGFGAFPTLQNSTVQAGDLDGPQVKFPDDHRIDNFRFSPNYRIDKILFHQIIGTVTDAVYVRPHARAEIVPGLTANTALIASWAVEGSSTPSGARQLGVEIDSGLSYKTHDKVRIDLTYAVLLPGAAFDNTMLDARAAQSVDATVGYAF